MKDEAKSQLEKIIGDYDAKLTEAARVEAAKREADAGFPERFVTLKAKTVRPALQEIADMLNAHGHDAALHEQEEASSTITGFKSASISLRIVPKPFVRKSTDANPSAVEIVFSAKRSERKVTVSSTNTLVSAGGSIGKRGEYDIDAVTSDVVTTHVLQTLNEAFGGPR
jgi:hypothetical protein